MVSSSPDTVVHPNVNANAIPANANTGTNLNVATHGVRVLYPCEYSACLTSCEKRSKICAVVGHGAVVPLLVRSASPGQCVALKGWYSWPAELVLLAAQKSISDVSSGSAASEATWASRVRLAKISCSTKFV